MGDSRRHRGPHPNDDRLFAKAELPRLRSAVADLSWLRTRGYAEPSALKLVGDRYQLRQRQRVAVGRCACSDDNLAARESRRVETSGVSGRALVVDGLNVLTTIEVALSGGVLLVGRDGCLRDMASFHGSYRLVEETERAIEILLDTIASMEPSDATVLIDRPVSNSGRLANAIRAAAASRELDVAAVTADRVDETLGAEFGVVATADSGILDACGLWLNLARISVERCASELERSWRLDLGP